jgi:membrane protein implicated in regulation of membrane protease activity
VKLLSNVLFLVALGVLVAAIVTGTGWLYAVAGFLAVDSFLATVIKRRMYRAKKAQATPSP